MEHEPMEARLDRLEEAIKTLEARLEKLEHKPARVTPREEPQPASDSAIDFTLIGKSVLIIGGAYVIRALTELGVLAQISGIVLAFAYAIVWIGLAERASNRGRRTIALFDAGTGAVIAGSLLWEATARFHALPPWLAAMGLGIAAAALLFIAWRHRDVAFAIMAAAMTGVICIGLAITTGEVIPPLLALASIGIAMALVNRWPSYLALALIAVSGGMAIPLLVMSRDVTTATIALTVVSAVMYVLAYRRADSFLAAAGMWTAAVASVLGIHVFVSLLWAAAALASAVVARRRNWRVMTLHAVLWAVAAVAGSVKSGMALSIVAIAAALALAVTPRDRSAARLVLLIVVTVAVIGATLWFLPESSPMIRTAILAIAAIILSLLARTLPEATIVARIVLVLGGAKLLVEDLRVGQATAIVAALAFYGGAMVIAARYRVQRKYTP
jgi:hypothetical protein